MTRFTNALFIFAATASLQAMAADVPASSTASVGDAQTQATANDAPANTPAKKKKPKKPMNELVKAFQAEVSQYQVKRKP